MNNLLVSGVSYNKGSESLSDISFELSEGESLAVVGLPDSGIILLGEIIAGIKNPDEGIVRMFDEPVSNMTKQAFGYVYDGFPLSSSLNIGDIDKILSSIYERWNTKTFNGVCYSFSIPRKKPVKELSPIQQRKLLLAIAISHATRLLVLNDVFNSIKGGMDDDAKEVLQSFLSRNPLRSLVVTTGHFGEVKSLVENFMILSRGKCLIKVSKKELENDYTLLECKKDDLKLTEHAVVSFRSEEKSPAKVLIHNRYLTGKNKKGSPATIDCLEKLAGEYI